MNNFWTNTLVSAAPFILLALLWFFLFRKASKNSAPIKQAAAQRQEILAELQSLRQSIDALRKDLNGRR